MWIERLEIKNFRNISGLSIEPSEGVNLIWGDNAQGKTNLAEAIYLLTGQRSFRGAKDTELISFGEKKAVIEAVFFSCGRSQMARLEIEGKKTAELNGIPGPVSQLTGQFLAVIFSPAELALIQNGPSERRSFLDSAISQVMPRYMATMAAFTRTMGHRNSVIFDIAKYGGESQLEVWDRSFARYAYSVINARTRFLARLAPHAEEIFREIGGETLDIGYQSTVAVPDGMSWGEIKPQEGEEIIYNALAAGRQEDIKNLCTTAGPHRDDIFFKINGNPARNFGSQGQQRSCALALKLAQCAVMEETLGERPVIILDDVLSELDKQRRDYLLKGKHSGQIFITTCQRAGARGINAGMVCRIKNGGLAGVKYGGGKPGPEKKTG